MGLFNSINISASGLTAERTRMDIISNNIANVNTTRTASGTPYRRKLAVFKENNKGAFGDILAKTQNSLERSKGVKISKVVEDKSPFKKIYDPGHPDANEDGYVLKPNVDVVKEMVDMISATRGYEANITAINSYKNMAMRSLDIGNR
ncbi:flagellar basal body rod protein FlgC [Dethiothermospora halolimnae]|uniref:flagellar basal body rod protein FlgC n=1 Tax=Dethiothermospora halolimnae TaxID=3114390 RepID=UPI003CCBC187